MDWRRRVDSLRTRAAEAHAQHARELTAAAELDQRLLDLREATELCQRVAAGVQSRAHDRIAEIVTKCLAIFDEPYRFRIHFDRKRGRTEARLVFERDGLEVDPLSGSGGGVVDVAAFALRVACLVLARPQLRRLLVLDEPFRHLSAAYRPKVKALLEALARDLQVQFVIVTHDQGLRAGTVVQLE